MFHFQPIRFAQQLISYVKILLLIIVYTAFICVDLPFLFSCNIENYLENLYKIFSFLKM